jgi:LPXTG-motif cell wall-anchored protein
VASIVGTFDIPSPGAGVVLLTAGGFLGGRRRRN